MTGLPPGSGEAGFALAVILAALVTYFWRALGVVLAGRLDPDGPVMAWVACVAYAILAALIARMILLPVGPLAETALVSRLAAAGLGALVYFALGRRMMLSVATAAVCLALISAAGG